MGPLPRRAVLAGALPWAARAQARPLRLGVLTTLSGPAADGAGTGSVLAARMAVEASGAPAEILAADMGDWPDIGAGLARAWFDWEGVQAVLDVPNSATALAVAGIARERNGPADDRAVLPGPEPRHPRRRPRNCGIPPTMAHAGACSATAHLLRAIAAGADPADGAAVVATMNRLPADDAVLGRSVLRADGGVSHPMRLFRVKPPAESRGD